MFDSKFTIEKHIQYRTFHFIISCARNWSAYLLGFSIFLDQDVLLRCFNSFILPCLKYCSPVFRGPLQQTRILNFLIRISELVNFRLLILLLVCSTFVPLAQCVCFTRLFIILCMLPILNFPPRFILGVTRDSLSVKT